MRSIWRTLDRRGLADIGLTCLAVFFIGLSYGAIAVASGFPLWVPAALSVLVLAGASEFLFIGIVAAGGSPIAAAEADYLATLLAACPPGARRDIYRIQADPGHPRVSEPHNAGVVEHVVIGAGRALVGVTGEPVELAPGDYIKYPGDVTHRFEALEPGTLAVLLSEHV